MTVGGNTGMILIGSDQDHLGAVHLRRGSDQIRSDHTYMIQVIRTSSLGVLGVVVVEHLPHPHPTLCNNQCLLHSQASIVAGARL
jgi:hypothetical protein